MPTLSIGDQSVQVDDSFLKLSPEQQNATVEEITKGLSIKGPQASAGPVANFAAGGNENVAATLGAPVDLMTGGLNLGARGINAAGRALGYDPGLGQISTPFGGSESIKSAMGLMGADPREVAAGNTADQWSRAAGAGATAMAAPYMAGRALIANGVNSGIPGAVARTLGGSAPPEMGAMGTAAGAAGNAVIGAGSALGGQAAESLLPEGSPYRPLANFGGQLAAGGALSAPRAVMEARARLTPPGAEELKASGSARYDEFRGAPVEYQRDAVAKLASDIKAQLESDGTYVEDAPKTFAKLGRMFAGAQSAAGEGVPLAPHTTGEMQSLRRSFGAVAGDQTDIRAAGVARRAIDDFLGAPAADAVASGTPKEVAEAADVFRRANGDYAAAQRSSTLTGDLTRGATSLEERASARASSTNSGGNYDNALRQNVRAFLQNDKNLRGFSDAEVKALEVVRDGTVTQNIARWLGRRLTSSVTTAVGAYGGSTFGPLGAAVGALIPQAVGGGLKRAENYLAQRGINSVDAMTRMRSPLYQEQLLQQALSAPAMDRGTMIARSLLPGLLAAPQATGLLAQPQRPRGGLLGY